jgi:hypothetical protein
MAEPQKSPALALAEAIANLAVTRSAEYRTIYSNVFRPRIGNGDVTLIFSKLDHAPSLAANANVLEEQVEIVMAWSQLKMLTLTLNSIVNALEQEVGEVKIPTSFKIDLENQRAVIRTLGFTSAGNE